MKFQTNLKIKNILNLYKKDDTHYYLIDNNKEWQFLEINREKIIIILYAPLKFVKVLE